MDDVRLNAVEERFPQNLAGFPPPSILWIDANDWGRGVPHDDALLRKEGI